MRNEVDLKMVFVIVEMMVFGLKTLLSVTTLLCYCYFNPQCCQTPIVIHAIVL